MSPYKILQCEVDDTLVALIGGDADPARATGEEQRVLLTLTHEWHQSAREHQDLLDEARNRSGLSAVERSALLAPGTRFIPHHIDAVGKDLVAPQAVAPELQECFGIRPRAIANQDQKRCERARGGMQIARNGVHPAMGRDALDQSPIVLPLTSIAVPDRNDPAVRLANVEQQETKVGC